MTTTSNTNSGMNSRRRPAALADAWCDDRGFSETVAVVLGAPLAVLVFVLVVFAGRASEAKGRVDHTAESAAQAGARERTAGAAEAAATATATASLSGICTGVPTVNVDTSNFDAGGVVTVTIACPIRTSDLAPLPLPGTINATGTSAAVIDQWRTTP
jgi:Flp pilus assembly protein TadG